ncbi:24859_t:CDS:1, partial [Racocetra persica]
MIQSKIDHLIQEKIKEYGIYFCRYDEFIDIKITSKCGYSKIEKANWRHHGLIVVLKSLKIGHEEMIVKAFVKE